MSLCALFQPPFTANFDRSAGERSAHHERPLLPAVICRADRRRGLRQGNQIYKFEKIKRAKRKALADFPNRPLIDFGIGENDSMAPASVRRKMAEEINQPANRGYMDNGNAQFKEAVARFMQRNFGVTLNPITQVNHSIGSKPALAMLPICFINPGDVTLMTVPGYPVAGT